MILRWFGGMRSFGDKVSWLLTLTSAVAIAFVCFTLSVVDYVNLRRETFAGLEAQSMIVAMNSGAPLAFGDRYSAAEALAAFRARPAVDEATLYDVNGAPFAQWRRPGPRIEGDGGWLRRVAFPQRWRAYRAPVEDRGQMLGRIEVRYDLSDLHAHLARSLALSAVVSLVAVLLVYLFALQIRGLLMRPIALLSSTARQVSETRDYALRARKVSDDELGMFTDTFNQMLEQIQKQDLEIQASRAEALHASRLKDEFLATLSHELRTPMTPILGWAQILQRSAGASPQVLQAAEVIERNARAQNKIVDDLLDMSRIVSGKVRLDVQSLDPNRLVADALETVAAAAHARGIALEREIEPGLPTVLGDPHRLQQVLWNLLSNAIKFTGPGGRVRISMGRARGGVEIAVSDTGQGIRSDFLPHVFERFRQADSSNTRHHAGLGLGLSIVKQLVELHGGSVRAESPGEGQGTTFTVSLPVRQGAVPALPPDVAHDAAQALPAQSREDAVLTGLKLLVVDDEADARELVGRLLSDCGADVLSVDSASAALQAMEAWRPDLLLSDIGMPDQNGYQLLQRVRAMPDASGGAIPAIALTAFARPEDRNRALEAGFQMHVSKPVEQAELLAAVLGLSGRG
jgi:signal transduction histidine kinase/ActR/RegA family two-component response regulator